MHYIIYIDKIWLLDFATGTYLLFLTGQTFDLKRNPARLLISAAAGAAAFVILLITPGIGFFAKLLIQIVCINPLLLKAAFSFRTKEMVVKAYACMNGYGLLLGGILACLCGYLPGMQGDLTLWKTLLVSTASVMLVSLYLYIRKKAGKNRAFYSVKLDFYGETLQCRGFADSGNSLYEPYKKRPVSVLEKQAAGNLADRVPPEKRYLVPYHSIGKRRGLLAAAELPRMEVDDGEEKRVFHKVVVAFSEEALTKRREYQVILHPEFVRLEE